jgi:hypothetical protein
MILQYKGFNRNWIFEESEMIATTKLNLNDFISRPDERKMTDGLEGLKELHEKIDNIIRSEIGNFRDKINYFVWDTKITDLEVVSVVMLEDKIYVLNSEAYLLNNNGKTVLRVF